MRARIPNGQGMQDPFGSMQGMMNKFQEFRQNPMGFMAQNRLNVPQQYANDINGTIQYLMNSGQLSQEQYNWAQNTARQIEQNPMFMQMFGGRR